jgi:methylenetetrahydrofolate reductase (NADPH)
MRFGLEASVELNVQDLPHLAESRPYLPAGARIYISHLPKQSFAETLRACAAVKAVGSDPIPHVPVRLLRSHEELNELVGRAADLSVQEMLLISGDHARPTGPFAAVTDVLQAIDLRALGIRRISIAGHPEGHPKVALHEIRRAELQKERIARDVGLQATFVTQFCFESAPFLQWAQTLRSAGTAAGIRAGLAGPAKLATLLRFAVRCGVGPSMKALGSKPGAFAKLLGEQGPEPLLAQLAGAAAGERQAFQGIYSALVDICAPAAGCTAWHPAAFTWTAPARSTCCDTELPLTATM